MQNISKLNFYIINIIFMIFPISLILGNFAVNLNILIFFLISGTIFWLSNEKIKLTINLVDKFVILFFLYSILCLIINFFEKKILNLPFNDLIFIKTIFFQRYLFLYLLIRILFEKKILQLNWFYFICALSAFFVCSDVIFQFLFGKDFFGITPISDRHYSAIFGDELIAGGYLFRFGFFVLFYLLFLNKKNFFNNSYFFFSFSFIILGIILSGNRMSIILFLFGVIIYFYLKPDFIKNLFKLFLIFALIFSILFEMNNSFKSHFIGFYEHGLNIFRNFVLTETNVSYKNLNAPYMFEFNCAKKFIYENPIFGGGIKSYRTHTGECLSHPHNYYLEIFGDLGLIGLILLIMIFVAVASKIKSYIKVNKFLPISIITFLIILILEMFPIRTSGSFFSTFNASIIFIFFSILVSALTIKIK